MTDKVIMSFFYPVFFFCVSKSFWWGMGKLMWGRNIFNSRSRLIHYDRVPSWYVKGCFLFYDKGFYYFQTFSFQLEACITFVFSTSKLFFALSLSTYIYRQSKSPCINITHLVHAANFSQIHIFAFSTLAKTFTHYNLK